MFERFTKRSRMAVSIANTLTRRHGGNVLGDVELLLGIVHESHGSGSLLLVASGVDTAALRDELDACPRSRDGDAAVVAKLPQTREFKLAITDAIAVSQQLSHSYVGTEHLLLGLLRHPEFEASRILSKHGVTFDGVRQLLTAPTCEG